MSVILQSSALKYQTKKLDLLKQREAALCKGSVAFVVSFVSNILQKLSQLDLKNDRCHVEDIKRRKMFCIRNKVCKLNFFF